MFSVLTGLLIQNPQILVRRSGSLGFMLYMRDQSRKYSTHEPNQRKPLTGNNISSK